MSQPVSFVPLNPVEPEVEKSARYADMREVSPLVDRPAPYMWKIIFKKMCDDAAEIDWKAAGFALCSATDVDQVSQRLRDITEATNAALEIHLQAATPTELSRLLEEGTNFTARDGESYRVGV